MIFFKHSNKKYYSIERLTDYDPKSKLQEEIVKITGNFPKFESCEIDPSLFELKITLEGKVLGTLIDTSKKKGFKKLAKKILIERSYIKN